MLAPSVLVFSALGAVASLVNRGRAASSSTPTSAVGTSMPSVPGMPKPVTRNVISGGPTAMPTLPPSANQESAVALRSPATAVAVR